MTHPTKRILLLLISMLPFFVHDQTLAHGGGGLGGGLSKPCEVKIGPYSLHLTGYQPNRGPDETFCENFPGLGPSVLAIDFSQNALRRMNIDVRIVRANSWSQAESGGDDSKNETIAHFPVKTYPKGLLTLSHNFTEKGIFAAVIRIENGDGSQQLGRVPFSVAMPARNIHRNLFIVLLAMIGIGHLMVNVLGKSKPVPENAN